MSEQQVFLKCLCAFDKKEFKERAWEFTLRSGEVLARLLYLLACLLVLVSVKERERERKK